MTAPANRRVGSGRDRHYLLVGQDIYILDNLLKLELLESIPKKGAYRWNSIYRKLRAEGVNGSLKEHVRDLINAGLVGVISPRRDFDLWKHKLYRTDVEYHLLDLEDVKELTGKDVWGR